MKYCETSIIFEYKNISHYSQKESIHTFIRSFIFSLFLLYNYNIINKSKLKIFFKYIIKYASIVQVDINGFYKIYNLK